jgi:hypothetical protein
MHTFARCTHFGDARGHAIDAAPHGGLGNVAVHWCGARSTAAARELRPVEQQKRLAVIKRRRSDP